MTLAVILVPFIESLRTASLSTIDDLRLGGCRFLFECGRHHSSCRPYFFWSLRLPAAWRKMGLSLARKPLKPKAGQDLPPKRGETNFFDEVLRRIRQRIVQDQFDRR